jgi:hypothetical protein
MRLDDPWFIHRRGRLLDAVTHHPDGELRHAHIARGILNNSRLSGPVETITERAIGHLAPRHRGAVRAHMQLYRAALEMFGFLPSDAIVNAAVQIEWLWYITPFKDFYRDHLAHVMKVALSALDLLESKESPFVKAGKTLLDQVSEALVSGDLGHPRLRNAARRLGIRDADLGKSEFWKAAVLETTRLAGLLHDMAYPDVMAAKVERAAKPVRPRAPFEPGLEDTCRNAVAMLQHHLLASPFHRGKLPGPDGIQEDERQIAASVFRESHSLRAGYSLLRILEDARRVGEVTPFDAFVMEWAALAISLHDYDKFYEVKPDDKDLLKWLDNGNREHVRPSYEADPVSFIVALADQLQDFGRMSYEVCGDDVDLSSARIRYPMCAVELDMRSDHALTLTFELGDGMGDGHLGPKDVKMIRDIRNTKHKGLYIFAQTEKPGTPWLKSDGLYKKARIEVTHNKKPVGPDGKPVDSDAKPLGP